MAVLRRVRWLEAGLIPLAVAVMWTAWIAPLLHLLLNAGLADPPGARFPGWLVLALLLGARLVRRGRWAPAVRAGLGLVAVMSALAYVFRADIAALGPVRWLGSAAESVARAGFGYPAPLVVFLASAFVWLWGTAVSAGDYAQVLAGFGIGAAVLALLLLVPDEGFWHAASIWGYLLAFLVAALLSLGLASVQRVLASEGLDGPHGALRRREWPAVVTGTVLAVLALGWLAASFVSPEAVSEALRPLWRAIAWLLDRALLAFAYVAFALLEPLIPWLRAIFAGVWAGLSGVLGRLLEGMESLAEARGEASAAVPESGAGVLATFRIALVVLLVLGVAVTLYLAYRRRPRRDNEHGDWRESVLSRELLAAQLRALRVWPRRPGVAEPYLRLVGDDPRLAVRRLYRSLLVGAGKRGRARPPGRTPRAYARDLGDLLAGEGAALATLTEVYHVARYAPEPPTPEQCEAAARAWERLASRLAEAMRDEG